MTQHGPGPRWVPLGEPLIGALRDEITVAKSDTGGDNPLGPVTVVVPSFQSAYFLRRRLAADGPLFNVQFLRLEDFADAIAGPEDGRQRLSRLRASEIVYAVATDPTANLPEVLSRIREQDGFHRALHRTLDDLDAARVDPDDPGWGDSLTRDTGSAYISAVAGLWRRYRERASIFTGPSDTASTAADAVRINAQALNRFGRIVLVLVEEPPQQHRELVSALLHHPTTRVLIGGTGDGDSDRLMARLPGVPVPEPDTQPARGEFRLISVPDPAEEARWIVRDVLAAARDGTPFGRVGVFFEESSYGPRLTEAFELNGVPISGPSTVTLAQTPFGRWILGLLATLESRESRDTRNPGSGGEPGFARDRLAAWVTGSDVKGADGRPAAGARWDVISRRAGVVEGAASWNDRLASHAARLRARADKAARQDEGDEAARSGWIAEANESDRLREFVRELAAEGSPADTGASWREFVAWIRRLADRYGGQGIGAGPDADQDDAAQAVSKVLDAIADLDSIDLPPPTFERFRRTLMQELDRPLARVGRLGRGVFVAPLRQAVGCDFDRIYVIGMAEGHYPSIGSEDPLLPDALRSALPGLKTLADERASARRRYLTALGTAPLRVLLWPRSQPGATRLVWPSRWFREAAEAVSGKPLGADLLDASDSPVEIVAPAAQQPLEAEPADRYEYDLKSLAAWIKSDRELTGHYLFRSSGATLGLGRDLEQGRFRTNRFTVWDGAIGRAPGNAPGDDSGAHRVIWSPVSLSGAASPTRLESWATCPFKYFLRYEVGVEPTEAPEAVETLSALDRGILIHDILDRFVKETLANPPRNADADAARLQEVAQQQMDAFERNGLTGRPVMWRLERERIGRGLLDFLDVHRSRIEERGERPVATELGFGDGEAVPAVVLQLPGDRTVRFKGWIDRVDFSDDGSRATVIDYKSGRADNFSGIKKDPVDGGRHLQLPIYALAVQGWKPETSAINAEFWFVMDTAGARRVTTSLEDSVPRLKQVVGEIIEGIQDGVFPAYPGDGSIPDGSGRFAPKNCAYCPYDRICPGGRGWAWERKAGDPAAARLAGLSDIRSAETPGGEGQ
ncbi:MAG: PD-(D/E)XK nuclease family protein [Chloroflexi bacterium]|nr:PD-(D/E)XK nuclease family protein [Chloroflexota bacterium]